MHMHCGHSPEPPCMLPWQACRGLPGSDSFTAPCPEGCAEGSHWGAQVPWRQMWAHLHHESAVAAPLLQLLQRASTSDRTVCSEALACIAALVGVPWELSVLLEFSWSLPLLGVNLCMPCWCTVGYCSLPTCMKVGGGCTRVYGFYRSPVLKVVIKNQHPDAPAACTCAPKCKPHDGGDCRAMFLALPAA